MALSYVASVERKLEPLNELRVQYDTLHDPCKEFIQEFYRSSVGTIEEIVDEEHFKMGCVQLKEEQRPDSSGRYKTEYLKEIHGDTKRNNSVQLPVNLWLLYPTLTEVVFTVRDPEITPLVLVRCFSPKEEDKFHIDDSYREAIKIDSGDYSFIVRNNSPLDRDKAEFVLKYNIPDKAPTELDLPNIETLMASCEDEIRKLSEFYRKIRGELGIKISSPQGDAIKTSSEIEGLKEEIIDAIDQSLSKRKDEKSEHWQNKVTDLLWRDKSYQGGFGRAYGLGIGAENISRIYESEFYRQNRKWR